jgi:prepilin-type N-terminal cleavage/methylation domain-containing protein/prepilin-type processing-associated H-X9-DG protein
MFTGYRFAARRGGFTLIELLVVIAIIALLIMLLLPAVQNVRSVAARTACANNLHQIGLGLQNYSLDHGSFPPAYNGVQENPGWGWGTFLLPYFEQNDLYAALDVDNTVFGDGANPVPPIALTQTKLNAFICPSDASGYINEVKRGFAKSNYRGIYGPFLGINFPFTPDIDSGGVLFQNSNIREIDIADGTSSTVAVGECYENDATGYTGAIWSGMEYSIYYGIATSDVMWGIDSDEYVLNGAGAQAFASRHSGGVHFAFCDGSVHFIKTTVDPQLMIYLCGRNDGAVINAGDY